MSSSVNDRSSSNGEQNVSPLPDVVGLGGALAGLLGGLAAMFVGAAISISLRGDVWLQAKQIAAILYGDAATAQPGFAAGPVIVGTLIHLVTAAILGAVFGIVTRRLFKLPSDYGAPVVSGLIYGMITWTVAYFALLPIFNPTLLETYAPSFIIQHIVFGIVTGMAYARLRPDPYYDTAHLRGAIVHADS